MHPYVQARELLSAPGCRPWSRRRSSGCRCSSRCSPIRACRSSWCTTTTSRPRCGPPCSGAATPGVYNLAGPGELTMSDLRDALGWYSVPIPDAALDGAAEFVARTPMRARPGAVDREPPRAGADGHRQGPHASSRWRPRHDARETLEEMVTAARAQGLIGAASARSAVTRARVIPSGDRSPPGARPPPPLLVGDHVHHRVDQRQVGERLRVVAEVPAGVGVELLGVQPERRGVREQPLAQRAGALELADLRQRA